MSFSASEPFKATKIWNDLVDNLKSNLEPRKRRWKLQTFENCFKGSDVVGELQNYVFKHPELVSDPSKVQVKSLGQFLLESRVIESVTLNNDGKKDSFERNGNHLYRFVKNQDRTEESSKNSEKPERKKKRLSLDRWNVHKRSAKRRSVATCSNKDSELDSSSKENMADNHQNDIEARRKRRKSFGGSSGFKGVDYLNALVDTPRKIRRRSFIDHNKKSKAAARAEEIVCPPNIYRDIWSEVTLSSLLKLLDVSYLEDVLIPPESDHFLGEIELANNPFDRLVKSLNDSSSSLDSSCELRGGRRGRDSIWKQAAIECFNALKDYPLPQESGFEFHNKVVITEAGISNSLAKYYGSLTDSLIPAKFVGLLEGIKQLLKARKKVAVSALRLLILLMPEDRQEHLKRLLNFFQKSLISQARISAEQRKKYLCRIFANGMLPSSVQNHEMTEQLLLVMMSEHEKLFHVTPSIKLEVKRHLTSFQQGIDNPILALSACRRVSPRKYEQQKEDVTRESLNNLMNCIVDDLTMSIKMKERLLRDFHTYHPELLMTSHMTVDTTQTKNLIPQRMTCGLRNGKTLDAE